MPAPLAVGEKHGDDADLAHRRSLCTAVSTLTTRHVNTMGSGNAAMCVAGPQSEKWVLVTASGKGSSAQPADLVVIDAQTAAPVFSGQPAPSIETGMLLKLVGGSQWAEGKTAMHTHAAPVVAACAAGAAIPPFYAIGGALLGCDADGSIPVAGWALPGTEDLARRVAEAMLPAGANACGMQGHGAVVVGKSPQYAAILAEQLHVTAEVANSVAASGNAAHAWKPDARQHRDFRHYLQGSAGCCAPGPAAGTPLAASRLHSPA